MAVNSNITFDISARTKAPAAGAPGHPGAGPLIKKPLAWKKWGAIGGVLALVIGIIVLIIVLRGDPEIADVKNLAAQRFDPNLSGEDRRKAFQAFREARDNLTDDQRKVLDEDIRKQMEARFLEREKSQLPDARAFRELQSQAEKDAFLDQKLAEMQQRREEMRARWAANGGGGGRGGPGGFGGFGGPGGPGGPGQRWGGENADQRMKDRLDQMPPEDRADMRAYRQAMQARGAATGMGFGGRGGGGGGGGGGR
jgi:hypothetical protein